MPEARAVAIAVGRFLTPEAERLSIEKAMLTALRSAQAKGITDPAALRAIMLAARDTAN